MNSLNLKVMGNINIKLNSHEDPFGGRRIVIVSQNGVTIDGQPIDPEQFQQFQQQTNFNVDNSNSSNFNVEPTAPDQDSNGDSDSDSYYSDSEINEEGVDYDNFVEEADVQADGDAEYVNVNFEEQGLPQGVPVIIFNTSGHSTYSMPRINHHPRPPLPPHQDPCNPAHPLHPLNPNNYNGVIQTQRRNERMQQDRMRQDQQQQRHNEQQRNLQRTFQANTQRMMNERVTVLQRNEQQRWMQDFHARTRRIQQQNNPIRPPAPPRPIPPPVFRRR